MFPRGSCALGHLLPPNFEVQELHDFPASVRAELLQQMQDLHIFPGQWTDCRRRGGFLGKEIRNFDPENPENFEEIVQRNPILALFHAGEIRLLNANLACQVRLAEMSFLPQTPQARPDLGGFRRTGLLGTNHLVLFPVIVYHHLAERKATLPP